MAICPVEVHVGNLDRVCRAKAEGRTETRRSARSNTSRLGILVLDRFDHCTHRGLHVRAYTRSLPQTFRRIALSAHPCVCHFSADSSTVADVFCSSGRSNHLGIPGRKLENHQQHSQAGASEHQAMRRRVPKASQSADRDSDTSLGPAYAPDCSRFPKLRRSPVSTLQIATRCCRPSSRKDRKDRRERRSLLSRKTTLQSVPSSQRQWV